MHEVALIQKIVENAEAAAKNAGIKNVSTLRMRIGKMSGLEPGQLEFLFQTYEKDAGLKETRLEVEEIPVELECPECSGRMETEGGCNVCRSCGYSHCG